MKSVGFRKIQVRMSPTKRYRDMQLRRCRTGTIITMGARRYVKEVSGTGGVH